MLLTLPPTTFMTRGLCLLLCWGFSSTTFAGLLAGIGTQWVARSFVPLEHEATPNYFSLGLNTSFGWSFNKAFDLNIYARYDPANLETAKIGEESARFLHYGGEIAFRIVKAVYVGVRGGEIKYRLFSQSLDEEIQGTWKGSSAELSIGGVVNTSRLSFLQIAMDLGGASLKSTDPLILESRTISWVGLSVTYVYIGLDSLSFNNIALRDWLKF